RLVMARPVPLLGVIHGILGFLVEVAPDQLPSALKRLAAGGFCIEQYAWLGGEARGKGLGVRGGVHRPGLGRGPAEWTWRSGSDSTTWCWCGPAASEPSPSTWPSTTCTMATTGQTPSSS